MAEKKENPILKVVSDVGNKINESNQQKNREIINEILTKESNQSDTDLYGLEELRPLFFSKTITKFDVYETDEENFTPYISPLATVGTVKTSSNSTVADTITEDSTSSSDNKSQETQQEDNGWGNIAHTLTGGLL